MGFVTNHVGITAEMATSLLVRSMQSNSTFNSFDANPSGNNPAVNTTLANQNQTQIVPELDNKLGVTYAIRFNSGSSWTFQAGYIRKETTS